MHELPIDTLVDKTGTLFTHALKNVHTKLGFSTPFLDLKLMEHVDSERQMNSETGNFNLQCSLLGRQHDTQLTSYDLTED